MRRLWPPGPDLDGDLDRALLAHYAYPDELSAPRVRVSFVASLDGAMSIDGVSGGLGSAADRTVFGVLRRLADVVLVGAGTVRAEDYRGARRPTEGRELPPPIAVVSGSADLDPTARLFTDTAVAPIVLTTSGAPRARRDALRDAGGDVVELPDLAPPTLLAELARRGLHRVLCEGGPALHGALAGADAIDELCLTLCPALVAGDAGRIAAGPATMRPLRLAGALLDPEALLLHYVRADDADGRRATRRSGDTS